MGDRRGGREQDEQEQGGIELQGNPFDTSNIAPLWRQPLAEFRA
jgi:hypothetical protein